MSEHTSEPAGKPERKKRGFALLSASKRAEIASKGGTTAHRKGRAHRFTQDEAKAAAAKSVAVRKARRAAS